MARDDAATIAKVSFLTQLSREEQLSTLWDLCQANRNEQARDKKEHVEIKKDLDFVRGEITGIGRRQNTNPSLTTSQKINSALEKRSVAWIWYRDKVLAPTLAAVHTLIIMALLYLAFSGGKLP